MRKGLIFIILIMFFSFGSFFYFKEGVLPVNKNDRQAKIFVIKRNESLTNIINNLEAEKLIRNKLVFYLIIKKLGIEKNIQAGDFRLYPSMNSYEIADTLTHGTLDIWITIIEGLREEEIAEIVGKNFTSIPEFEFISKAKEGYLFPDTYLIPRQSTADDILKILYNNFNKKFSSEISHQAKNNGLSDQETLILSSLVEKESKVDMDRQKIASILLKRYRQSWPLQVDASVQYALGYQADEKTWWKKNLTIEDLRIKSPYNTYETTSLPPGPICSPGLASIKAVVTADENIPYWYYLSDKKGNIHYANTIEEHQQNINQYLGK